MPSVVFLGTSAGTPTRARNVTSHAFRLDDGRIFLIDCGEGTQHQIVRCPELKSSKIDVILITHMHGDHLFGIQGLLASLSLHGRSELVKIFGPFGIKSYLDHTIQLSATYLTFPVEVVELAEGKITKLGTLNSLEVTAYPLKHKVTSFGFLIVEPDKRGKLDAKKAEELGASKKDLGILSSGKDITLANGTVIKSSDVIGETRKGKKLVFLGDTSDSDSLLEDGKNCDLLVHEVGIELIGPKSKATFDATAEEKAIEGGHSTSAMAGRFAKRLNASRMILTHFSMRYHGLNKDEPLTVEDLGKEAQKECPDTQVLVADDFKKFEL